MKKLTALFLSLMLVLGLSACGTSDTAEPSASADSTSDAASEDQTAAESGSVGSSETKSSAGKALVVYFSASGNTERVAKDIAAAVGADIFEIVPAKIYTKDDLDWTKSDSRVSREHDEESLRDVPLAAVAVENWDSYNTVFIGYPIWWGIAAWPVNGFVKANDFTGKKVIPFATSSSSGMGQSGSLLAAIAGTGDWQEGHRFSSGASAADVGKWVNDVRF